MKKISSVMLIDDDETTNYINKLTVTRAEITDELLISLDGKAALDVIQQRCEQSIACGVNCVPELILLDINMPVLDGFGFLEALARLEAMQKHKVVIAVLTTSLNPRDVARVKDAGVTELLNKPLTRESLLQLVNKYFPSVSPAVVSN
ncbi:response regulator [Pontibacter sp. Tf4]|uniref:response regulator n=1 Tax=Pontibacter sp. Tf4 TaxID=2761620 RepID=UPI00162693AA|nr:response regulator [Pontibacter sp. Tf4]MBB6611611.1 response regulator [Pontibacter sp. Tf4]